MTRKPLSILATSVASMMALAPMARAELGGVGAVSPDNHFPIYYQNPETVVKKIADIDGAVTDDPRPEIAVPHWLNDQPLRLEACISNAEVLAEDPEAPGTLVASPLCLLEAPVRPAIANDGDNFPANYPPNLDPDTGLPIGGSSFPDEFFYWHGDSDLPTATEPGGDPGRARLVLALEGAFLNEAVKDPDQIVFGRIRFRIDNLVPGEEYTITTPFGIFKEVADGDPGTPLPISRNINVTEDIGGFVENDFAAVLSAKIWPFLVPAGFTAADLIEVDEELFIADPGAPTAVEGSPLYVPHGFGVDNDLIELNPANFWRIEGPNVATGLVGNADPELSGAVCADPALGGVKDALGADVLDDCVETDQFLLMGKLATKFGVQPARTTYTRVANGTGRIDVLATSIPGQRITARMSGPAIDLVEEIARDEDDNPIIGANGLPVGTGSYFGRFSFNTGARPLLDEMRLTNESDLPATETKSKVIDSVQVQQASFNTTGLGGASRRGVLTLRANSSDNIDNADEAPSLMAFSGSGKPLRCVGVDGSGNPVAIGNALPDNQTVTCAGFALDSVIIRSIRNPNSVLGGGGFTGAGGGGEATQQTVISGPNVAGP